MTVAGGHVNVVWHSGPVRCELVLLVLRLHDTHLARALKPDIAVVSTAIQIASPLEVRCEGPQGVADCPYCVPSLTDMSLDASFRCA